MSKLAFTITSIATALIASPAMAQQKPAAVAESGFRTEDMTGPRGVFSGKIGRYPVIACFDARYGGDGFGSYYYLSQLKPIPLAANDAKDQWSEGSVYDFDVEEGAALWAIRTGKTGDITGIWRSGKRSYPITLTRIAKGAEEYEGACGKDSFLGPRLGAPEFTQTPASLDNFSYTIMKFESPAHFPEVAISGFAFEASQPGDGAIIEKLTAMLPQGSTQDDYVQCMAGNLAWRGVDGDFSQTVLPRFVNDQLLSFETTNGSYCGGAHPNFWQEFFLYDRRSGNEIDPSRWFNEASLKLSDYDAKLMQPALRKAIMAQWPNDGEPDCISRVQDEEYWTFQLLKSGISFQPNLAHVLTVCEEQVLLSWEQVEPFLSDEGRMIRNRAEQ